MEELVTVDYLLNLFQYLHDKGYGDMNIKCNDNYLYEDEVSINYLNREIALEGFLFNYPLTKKAQQFVNDVNTAMDKFCRYIEDTEEK